MKLELALCMVVGSIAMVIKRADGIPKSESKVSSRNAPQPLASSTAESHPSNGYRHSPQSVQSADSAGSLSLSQFEPGSAPNSGSTRSSHGSYNSYRGNGNETSTGTDISSTGAGFEMLEGLYPDTEEEWKLIVPPGSASDVESDDMANSDSNSARGSIYPIPKSIRIDGRRKAKAKALNAYISNLKPGDTATTEVPLQSYDAISDITQPDTNPLPTKLSRYTGSAAQRLKETGNSAISSVKKGALFAGSSAADGLKSCADLMERTGYTAVSGIKQGASCVVQKGEQIGTAVLNSTPSTIKAAGNMAGRGVGSLGQMITQTGETGIAAASFVGNAAAQTGQNALGGAVAVGKTTAQKLKSTGNSALNAGNNAWGTVKGAVSSTSNLAKQKITRKVNEVKDQVSPDKSEVDSTV